VVVMTARVPQYRHPNLHGKEGVNGSSPLEGSAKAPHVGAFVFRSTCSSSTVWWIWSRLWSFRVSEGTGARDQCPLSRRVNAGDELWMCDPDAPQPSANSCADCPRDGSANRAAAIGVTLA
jgi:hypothetical protein